MYSDEVLDFIYLLNNPGIKICLEGKNIKISFPEGVVDTAQYAHFIKVNRETLIRILNDNQVFNFT